mgnify:FL=1
MNNARNNAPEVIGDYKVLSVSDYKENTKKIIETGKVEETGLPQSNVFIL